MSIGQLGVTPRESNDGRSVIDGKLNAALKELLLQSIGSTSAIVERIVDEVPLDYRNLLDQTLQAVIVKHVVPVLRRHRGASAIAEQLVKRRATPRAPTIAKLLQIDVPVAEHPVFAADVRRIKLGEALRISGLGNDLVDKLDASSKALESWSDLDWDATVANKVLTTTQRDDLRFTVDLIRLTEHHGLAHAARKANIATPEQLVTMTPARWLELVHASRAVPAGMTEEAYVEALDKTVQRAYPARYFAARIADGKVRDRLPALWNAMSPVLAANPELRTSFDPSDIDWTGLDDRLAPTVHEALALLGTYRHLGLADVAGDSSEVGRRIAALDRFLRNNHSHDLRYVNLLDDEAPLDWTGIDDADVPRVRNQVLAYQRVLHLSPDHDTAVAMLRAGLDSSAAIADLSYRAFRERTRLADDEADAVYRKASHASAKITNGLQLQKDALSLLEHGKLFQGIDPKFVNDLKDIAGYAELFGNTTYCDCEHCRSIFSPAAYFTDLMYFIEKNITKVAFAGKPTHPIRLRTRRPDLWHLKLTCANTNELIPHLTLVIEILESYLERSLSIPDVPAALAADRRAIRLPFDVSLATVREYLREWKLDLAQVYRTLEAAESVQLAETLGLSDAEWGRLVQPGPLDIAWITFPTADHTRMDANDFLRFTGLTRSGLEDLAETKIAGDFTIARVPTSFDIQSEKEVVQGLTNDKLDRIGRFLRLSRSSGFTLIELDELLTCDEIGGPQPFDTQVLARLARIKRLSKTLRFSVDQMVSVIDHIPTRALEHGGNSLAARIGLVNLSLPRTFHHAQFATAIPDDATIDAKLPVLQGVTGLAESDLLLVFQLCPQRFPFDPNGNVQLTANNVALLYAYAALAKQWRISVRELAHVVRRRLNAPDHDFRTLELLEQLAGEIAALKSLPVSITDAFALVDPDIERVSLELVTSVVGQLQQSGARWFDANLLAAIPGMTSDAVASTLATLVGAGLVEHSGDRYALTGAYTTATDLAATLDPALPVLEIHAALLTYHFANLLPNALAATAGMDVERTLIAFAFARPGWDTAAMIGALATPIVDGVATQPADLAPLHMLANDLSRVRAVFEKLELDADDAWFIAQYPSVFGIADVRTLDITDLVALRRYRQLRKLGGLSTADAANLAWQYQVRANGNQVIAPAALFGSAARSPVFAAALAAPERAARVAGPVPTFSAEILVPSPLAAEELELWAARAGLDLLVLRSVLLSVALPTNAIAGLTRALDLYALCQKLGTRASSLSKLLARDPAALQTTTAWLRDLIKQKHADETAREEALSVHTRALNELRRDALCDYIVARDTTLGFRDRTDLYAYFLIDVEMAGCFDTSRVVAALSSLQLYVHRCLINLEQAKSDGLSVLPAIDAEDIQQEWEWRKNYRVWEANRKVFLYPENYIEPELRDDKTPLFETLEDDLLQREITLDAAESAYHDYLATFSTLARLKVVAVTYDEDGVYWFIARSHSDPYKYYLRRYFEETERWEAWEAIDVGISAPYVSALIHLGRLYLFWVDIGSQDRTEFVDGNSIFLGIQHKVQVQYACRESNGKWTAAQKLTMIDKLLDRAVTDETPPFIKSITNFAFVGIDKAKSKEMAEYYRGTKTYAKVIATPIEAAQLQLHYYRQSLRTDTTIETIHSEMVDGNLVQTVTHDPVSDQMIDRIFIDPSPGELVIVDDAGPSWEYHRSTLDLITNEITNPTWGPAHAAVDGNLVPYVNVGPSFQDSSNGVEAVGLFFNKNLDNPEMSSITLMLRRHAAPSDPAATDAMLIDNLQSGGTFVSNGINAKNAHDVLPVHSKQAESVLQHGQHQHWLKLNGNIAPRRLAVRINTTLDYFLTERLFTGGLERFLTLETQTSEGEGGLSFQSTNDTELKFTSDLWGEIPYKGSFGRYYRELFFHIPHLIANQLNSQGRYAEAKHWYEKIFNPMAPAPSNDTNINHRVWQYLEFRDVPVQKLKELLNDKATIAVYHDDPFNPHAIARLRLSAYQKSIVMKYVDNLIDWADDLFTQATMESVNEAIMLYVLAAEILGPRPVSVGACKTADEDALTYAVLGPAIEKGSEFLMYVENVYNQIELESKLLHALPAAQQKLSNSVRRTSVRDVRKLELRTNVPSYKARRPASPRRPRPRPRRPGRRPGIMRHYLPAFCVPPNEKLLAYWDRIADRLFKIRHCLDINGQPLTLALFQPPIDPMLLVRAKAAGLSIEDVIGQLKEPLPAYRFSFLLEKARQYIGTVQTFGSALLGALEKKDSEQLQRLRSTHEQNFLKLQRAMKHTQIDEARAQQAAAEALRRSAQAKLDHFTNLLASGLNTWESLQETLKHTATGLQTAGATLRLVAGIAWLIPDTGSPFAMKYGGTQLGASQEALAQWYGNMAQFADGAASSAGLEASFQRRTEEWEQSLAQATEELAASEQSVKAATLRVQLAERDLELLEAQLEQAADVHDFLTTKFTNTELYTYMSGELMKLYREAYQMAAQIARQAERAFQFERDSGEVYIQTDNWQSDRSGLLAGDRLIVQLNRMEKAYLETNARDLEVRQSLSLHQLDPSALQSLRQTGKCEFTIDEVWFDLLYPGQYRRLLKAVRLTIPCVVGPYVNVAAKLQLLGSQVRRAPGTDPVDVPLTMTRTIATSHAQNDSGMFELSFRDDRYLPFEGAGAVNSTWLLELPSQLRVFDYASLADVIISFDYTARYDGVFATEVETNLVQTLKDFAGAHGLFHLVSMRHEFPDAFYQLCHPSTGQTPSTSFTLDAKHFPTWLDTQSLNITQPVSVWPQAKAGQTLDASALGLEVGGSNVGGWTDDGAGSSRGVVNIAGSPIRAYTVTADAIDKTQLADIVFLVRYSIG